jgi:hypothetical protein
MKVFENRALRNVFGPKREDVTEDWSLLDVEELHQELFGLLSLWRHKSVPRNVGFKWPPSSLHVLGCQLWWMFGFLNLTLHIEFMQLAVPRG